MSNDLDEAEDYLDKNVKEFLEPMISSLLDECPAEPNIFMMEWLGKFLKISNQQNNDKSELENLRKEILKFRTTPIKEEKFKESKNEKSDDSEQESGEEQDKIDELINQRKNMGKAKGQRGSVSAEAYGMFNKKLEFVPKVIVKTQEQRDRIYKKIIQSFLFNSLEEKDINTVIDAMEEKKFRESDYVIRQGESGASLFLIEIGKLDCFKTFVEFKILFQKKEDGDKYLKTYIHGEAFGELALLYNAPRAASIVAQNDCLLWELDRETFNNIVKTAAV